MRTLEGGELSPGLWDRQLAGIVGHRSHAGHSTRHCPPHGTDQRRVVLRLGWRGYDPIHGISRVVLQDTGGLASSRVSDDGAAGDIGRGRADARETECNAV